MSEQDKTSPANGRGNVQTAEDITPAASLAALTQPGAAANPNQQPPTRHEPVRLVALELLRPHDAQREIYCDQPGDALVGSIDEHGVLEPLLVTPENVIISGHLRHAASVKAGRREVPVITVNPADDEAAIDLLLNANSQRVKTNEQIAREATYRMKIEGRKARLRQSTGAAGKVPAKSPEATGDARAIVAKQMNMGPKKVDQCVAVVEKLDQLDASGDTEVHAAVTHALAKSINKAANKVLVFDERAKLTSPIPSPVTTTAPDTAVIKADIIARLQDDLIDGMENWTEGSLLVFEKHLAAFKADWFAREGEEEA